jgi:methylmalonyl-CoA mutase N-terminal domain/subunit
VTSTVDPLGGSYYLEALTDELEERAGALIARVDELGGAVAAIESGFVQSEIEAAAYEWTRSVESGERTIVGVNAYRGDDGAAEQIELHRLEPEAERRQIERTRRVRANRDERAAREAIVKLRADARRSATVLHPMRDALRASCTLGEICTVLREEWGVHDRGPA